MTARRLAIPIHADSPRRRGDIHTGSAFLVRLDGDTYLVTAAHVLFGRERRGDVEVVLAKWDKWPDTLNLHFRLGHSLSAPLFRESAFGVKQPLFGYNYSKDDTNQLYDVLWNPLLSLSPEIQAALPVEHHIFDIDIPRRPDNGEAIHCIGYPDTGVRFPTPEPSVVDGKVIKADLGFHLAEIEATSGYSGGPAVDDQNRLLGLTMGFTPAPDAKTGILSAEAMAHMIRSFQHSGPHPVPIPAFRRRREVC